MDSLITWAACTLVTALAALWLVERAPKKLRDDGAAERERKQQAHAVPLVLGTALLAGCIVACAFGWHATQLNPWTTTLVLCAAYGVGLCDDLAPQGLTPLVKLTGQLLVALVYAWALPIPITDAALAATACMVALNVSNTFDNADGAVLSVCAVPLLLVGVPLGAAAGALLPFNVTRLPTGARAYLGDSGSHLVGLLCLCATPVSWLLLVLPACDLALVSWARVRAGRAPWQGDRRHLAHRLQRGGYAAPTIALLLCGCGLLPLAGHFALSPIAGPLGAVGGTLLCLATTLYLWRLGSPPAAVP